MSRFRLLLLCLMMLALPLQGFAAASMLYCGMAVGQHGHSSQMEIGTSHQEAPDGKPTPHDHAMQNKIAHADNQSPGDHQQLPDSSHKCGVCATCCSVIAITEFRQSAKVQASPTAELAEPLVLIHAVTPRLPEKPPRA
jgi:hypothetical protein